MSTNEQKKFYELGIFIPLITVFSVAVVYYCELGYFHSLGIPYELIQIELSKNISLIFTFIAMVAIPIAITSILELIFKNKNDSIQKGRGKNIIALALLLIVSLVYIYGIYVYICWEVFPMIFCIIAGDILALAAFFKENKEASGQLFSVNSRTVWMLSFLFICTSVLSFFFFITGDSKWGAAKEYCYKPNKKTFLLRKYSAYTIYGVTDSSGRSFKEFIVERSSTDADTVLPIK